MKIKQIEGLQTILNEKANWEFTPMMEGEYYLGEFVVIASDQSRELGTIPVVFGNGATNYNIWGGLTTANAIASAQKTVIGIVSKTASFTLVTSDAGKYIRYDSVNEGVCTVPPYSTLQIPANTVITIRQAGAGSLTLQAGSGATLNGDLKTAGQHKNIQLINVTGDVWDVVGGIS